MDGRTTHWLKAVLTRAGAAGSESLAIEAGTPGPQAWAAATRALAIEESALAGVVARHFRLQVADLSRANPAVARLLPEQMVRKHIIVPLRETDRELFVATCDPMDLDAEQAVAFASGRQAIFEIAPPAELLAAIDRLYAPEATLQPLLRSAGARAAEAVSVVDQLAGVIAGAQEGESAAVVKLTNLILRAAIEHGSSEIEIGPGPSGGVVSFRVDTVWRTYMQLPVPALKRVVTRTGLLSNLGIANRAWSRGRGARIRVEGHLYDLRVTTHAEGSAQSVQIRIYDQQFAPQLGNLGLSTAALIRLRALLDHGSGLVLVTGPAGSGKSTLLAAAERGLAPQRSVASVEDVVECDVEGVTQREVDEHAGETMADVLHEYIERHVDVLAVSAVHDARSVQRVLDIARAGTLVLLAMPAEDPGRAIRAVLDLDAAPDTLAECLRGAIHVRLLRRLCNACATPAGEPDAEALALRHRYDVRPARSANGCPQCARTGYRGVLPILEIVDAAPGLVERIRRGASAGELLRAAQQTSTYRGLETGARERVDAGDTTPEEVHRAFTSGTGDAPESGGPLVLMADDDPVLRALARTILEQSGYRVAETTDGDEALDWLARNESPALLILDLLMPRLDGFAALTRLRGQPRTVGLPVIVLTASAGPEDELRAIELGADDYIRKPIDPPRFLARVRAALRRATA